ncbi:MAG: DUF4190 domain-containing protein [Deltaproteobacteria bacterium]|nr:DUF4190 domain-containing protein [Deltaproteobacteria bacterium]
MNCPRCGALHQPGAPMCTACGTPLTVSLSGAAPVPAYAAPPPYAPPQAAPQPYAAPQGAPPPYAVPQQYPQGIGYPQGGGYLPAAPVPYAAQPAAPSPYDAAAYPYLAPKTSAMAVIGFILAFLCNFVGLVLSIIALVRINNSKGQLRGKSLAIAGIILSAIFFVVGIVYKFTR